MAPSCRAQVQEISSATTPLEAISLIYILNNPFDYRPDKACEEAFGKLISRIEKMKGSRNVDELNFVNEIEAGKMLGVLIATDDKGIRHTLYAFSGQLGEGGFHFPGFVGPVFDYLEPDGHFKKTEADISCQNDEIAKFESETLHKIRDDYQSAKQPIEEEISAFKEKYRISKEKRAERRRLSEITPEDEARMIRQSQFEKAELRRLKKKTALILEPLAQNLRECEMKLADMKAKRRSDSEALQNWLFSNFTVLNARGESKSLKEIFSDTVFGVPPSGAGECCGPKLLQAAYLRGLTPLSMAEYWYGKSKDGEVRVHGMHYPACRGKCLPVLGWMLQGLTVTPPLYEDVSGKRAFKPVIIFENQWFCVADKPSGMLSVPGKSPEVSLEQWLQYHYGAEKDVRLAHRLDQHTSGLVIAAFGKESLKVLRMMFASRRIRKTYEAELEGNFKSSGLPRRGTICLPLAPDYLDRPRQKIDFERGKEAVTHYEFTGINGGCSRVLFYPQTGRTHQLRVHAASGMGLGMPIAGDSLYGRADRSGAGRLMLHARKLEFTFPIDKRHYYFESTEEI